MDFNKAIEAHSHWKLRLRKFFDSKGGSEEFDLEKSAKTTYVISENGFTDQAQR